MSRRTEELAERRRTLQMQCALQRQQIAHISSTIEARLVTADRVIDLTSGIARHPLALVGVVAGTMILGPWRIMKWVSQGAFVLNVASKVKQLMRP